MLPDTYSLALDAAVLQNNNHPVGLALSMIGSHKRVLELGSATGYVTRLLKHHLHCEVTGVELIPIAAEKARPFCQQLIIGDIESDQVRSQLTGPYDVILAGDVLEHLRYPEKLLMLMRSTLSAGGYWVISVPNIAHWSVRKELLFGRFEYAQRGIMDQTHLRWFTIRSLNQMLQTSGYQVIRQEAVYTLPMQNSLHLQRLATQLQMTRIAQGLLGFQLVVQARLQ